MNTSHEENTHANGTSFPTYMDRFVVHLAKELLGPKTVMQVLQEHLQGPPKSKEFGIVKNTALTDAKSDGLPSSPLYWRSDLFLEDPADMMEASKWPCAEKGKHLMYLDCRFEFCDKPKKQVRATWGCFLLHSNTQTRKYKNYGMYYKSKPMTLHCLEKHAETIQIELDSAPPQTMAAMMRPTLVERNKQTTKGKNIFAKTNDNKEKKTKGFHIKLVDPSPPKEDEGDSNAAATAQHETNKSPTIHLELDYREALDDTGVLILELQEESSSPYNEMGLEPFYWREVMRPTAEDTSRISPGKSPGESPLFGSQSQSMYSQSTYSQSTYTQSTFSQSQSRHSQNTFGSPMKATPSPDGNNMMVEFQLDKSLEEWFRQVDLPKEEENDTKKPAAAASNSMQPPPNKVKKRVNHNFQKVNKKKKRKKLTFGKDK